MFLRFVLASTLMILIQIRLAPSSPIHLLRKRVKAVSSSRIRCFSHDSTPVENPAPIPILSIHAALRKSLFTDYLLWHAAQRKCLQNRQSHCAPVLVWTCPPLYDCSGAGDRIKAILFSYVLAVVTRRVFLIHWAHPGALSYAMRPAHLDWTLPPHLIDRLHLAETERARFIYLDIPTLSWALCYPASARRCSGVRQITLLNDVPATPTRPLSVTTSNASLDLHTADLAHLLNNTPTLAIATRFVLSMRAFLSNPHFRPILIGDTSRSSALKDTNSFSLNRALLHALFIPTPTLERAMHARRKALGEGYSAVHARLGLDVGEERFPRFVALNQDLDRSARAVIRCLLQAREQRRRQGSSRGRGGGEGGSGSGGEGGSGGGGGSGSGGGGGWRNVYLATDGERFKEVFQRVSAEHGLNMTTGEGRVVHVAAEMGGCREYLEVFADLWLLARAEVLAALPSGFASAAAYLGDTKAFGQAFYNVRGEFRCELRHFYCS